MIVVYFQFCGRHCVLFMMEPGVRRTGVKFVSCRSYFTTQLQVQRPNLYQQAVKFAVSIRQVVVVVDSECRCMFHISCCLCLL